MNESKSCQRERDIYLDYVCVCVCEREREKKNASFLFRLREDRIYRYAQWLSRNNCFDYLATRE